MNLFSFPASFGVNNWSRRGDIINLMIFCKNPTFSAIILYYTPFSSELLSTPCSNNCLIFTLKSRRIILIILTLMKLGIHSFILSVQNFKFSKNVEKYYYPNMLIIIDVERSLPEIEVPSKSSIFQH